MLISLTPLIGICVLAVLAVRRLRALPPRRRLRSARISWKCSYKVLPVLQWSIQTDDADSIAWITHHLAGVEPPADAVLPLAGHESCSIVDKRRAAGLQHTVRILSYNYVSPILALIGSMLAMGVLLYQAGWTVSAIAGRVQALNGDSPSASGEGGALSKRSMGIADIGTIIEEPIVLSQNSSTVAGDGSILQPLIPGITIPLSHTIPLLLALFASQVIHELGHLIVAALHGITTSRLVAGIYIVFPFAAVVLPTTISDAKPKDLLRIAAAGPFHNLLSWLVILSLPLLHLSGLFYEDVSGRGVYVVQVQEQSPLRGHLPEHSVIVQLDDVPLGKGQYLDLGLDNTIGGNIWTTYLLPNDKSDAELERWNQGRGWCVDESAVGDSPSPPCPPSTGIRFAPVSDLPALSNSTHTATQHHCFSAYPLLTEPTVDCSTECTGDPTVLRSCLRPVDAENIIRIQFVPSDVIEERGERVVIFAGDRAAVHRDVRVSVRRPRGGTVGRVVIQWMELLLLYIATLSLALATLNLLPLPHLDGTHILSATLGILMTASPDEAAEDFDIDDEGETGIESFGRRRAEGRRCRWHRVISGTTMAFAAVCVGGGVILQALS